jgi:hypothetical protein
MVTVSRFATKGREVVLPVGQLITEMLLAPGVKICSPKRRLTSRLTRLAKAAFFKNCALAGVVFCGATRAHPQAR